MNRIKIDELFFEETKYLVLSVKDADVDAAEPMI